MTAFAAVIDILFADANLGADAVYRAGGIGPEVPVRVIMQRPDQVGDFGATRVVADTVLIDVRVNNVATPAAGDTFTIGGDVYVVQGEPTRDSERLIWTIEARVQ